MKGKCIRSLIKDMWGRVQELVDLEAQINIIRDQIFFFLLFSLVHVLQPDTDFFHSCKMETVGLHASFMFSRREKSWLLWISSEWESIIPEASSNPLISPDRPGSHNTGHCQGNGTIFIPIRDIPGEKVFQMHLGKMDLIKAPTVFITSTYTCPTGPFTEANTVRRFLCILLKMLFACSLRRLSLSILFLQKW